MCLLPISAFPISFPHSYFFWVILSPSYKNLGKGLVMRYPASLGYYLHADVLTETSKMLWCVDHALLTLAVAFGPLIMSWGFKIIIQLYNMIFCILIITYSCIQSLLTCSSISGPWLYRIKDQTLTRLMKSKYVPLYTCYQLWLHQSTTHTLYFPLLLRQQKYNRTISTINRVIHPIIARVITATCALGNSTTCPSVVFPKVSVKDAVH